MKRKTYNIKLIKQLSFYWHYDELIFKEHPWSIYGEDELSTFFIMCHYGHETYSNPLRSVPFSLTWSLDGSLNVLIGCAGVLGYVGCRRIFIERIYIGAQHKTDP